MTSVAQLMQAGIFQPGIRGDRRASDKNTTERSAEIRKAGALQCLELRNQDGHIAAGALTPLCVTGNFCEEKVKGGRAGFVCLT